MKKNGIPKLTIGMAHHTDFHGLYFTIQSLQLYHNRVFDQLEFVVIDNSPKTADSDAVRKFLPKIQKAHSVKYIEYEGVEGTSATRDHIFAVATAPHVLVMDCHVMMQQHSIEKLIGFYGSGAPKNDIYAGPIILDSFGRVSTHFDDEWGGGMWGRWASALQCPCGEQKFSVTEVDGKTAARELKVDAKQITHCHWCKRNIPVFDWAAHENKFVTAGYQYIGQSPKDEPFEIPGQGLGCFSAAKDTWLGFNEHARGFGGEELYIHEKYRQAGRKAICLPFLQWLHRFQRPAGTPYVPTLFNKVRNYVLEFNELGRSLDPIHKEFVESKLMKEREWEKLIVDPIKATEKTCQTCSGSLAVARTYASLDEMFSVVESKPRDLNEHLATLREYASKVDHVTEVTKRAESAVAFLAAKPKNGLRSFSIERSAIYAELAVLCERDSIPFKLDALPDIKDAISFEGETDMLFIDINHNADFTLHQLRNSVGHVKRFIAIHDTELHGENGENGGPGILPAVRQFVKEFPEWSVVYSTNHQYGLIVMSCSSVDKPPLPSKLSMAKNLMTSVAGYVGSGMENTSTEDYENRLSICSLCPQRDNDRCTKCGCYLAAKAALKVSECPLGLWPTIIEKEETSDETK